MENGEQLQHLTFVQGDEQFGIALCRVKEIIEYSPLTPVPMVPDMIRGILNLRGRVVPVIDLNVRFGHGPSEISRRSSIIIVELEVDGCLQSMGILVDAVTTVVDISPADIEPRPRFGAGMRSDFIGGMAKIEDKFVILLAVDKLLSGDELSSMADAAQC